MKSLSLKQQLFVLLILIVAFFSVNFGFYSSRKVFIDGDGNGYYAWLPAVFIYHTVDFEQFTKRSPTADERYHQPHYFVRSGEILINKYTCGTALLQTPLFLAALGVSHISGQESDGYGILFQYSAAISALLYLFLGLLFLKKLLRTYQLSDGVILVLLVAVTFATNLFFYTYIQPSLSHVYSFFTIALFAYFTRRAFSELRRRDLLLAAFALGLVVLIRPVNVIAVLAVPFLAGGPHAFLTSNAQRNGSYTFLAATGIFIATISPQLFILTLQTSSPFHWLYPGEGFCLNHPRILDFLFSYKKGWFVYTPFMLLLIPSMISLYKRSKYEFTFFLCFLLFTIYIFSAWWNWFYGDGFGMRPMVDYYGLFMIPIGIFLDRLTRAGKLIVSGIILLTMGLNLVQSFQYSRSILHADSMNRSAYWYTFMRTSSQYRNILGPVKESVFGSLTEKPLVDVSNDFERDYPDWIKLHDAGTERARSGNRSLKLDDSQAYSYGYPLLVDDTLLGRDNLYVNFSVYYYEPVENSALGAIFVADVLDSQYNSLYYRNFRLKTLPDGFTDKWRSAEAGFRLPHLYEDASQVRFYIWNKDQGDFYLDDMEIRIFGIK